ncbi:MAG: PA2169 family four-helix-bundle protein [Pseudomonadota bacterium]
MDRDDVVDVLNDLIENCKDGEYGFNACAENAKSAELKSVFSARADECRRAAEELQAQVVALGGKPADSGTAAGAVHRGWVAVRSTLSTYDDKAMLQECERGEDTAVRRYRVALTKPLPEDVRALVERQLMGAQHNHDQIKALRDRYPATT